LHPFREIARVRQQPLALTIHRRPDHKPLRRTERAPYQMGSALRLCPPETAVWLARLCAMSGTSPPL